MSKFTPGPWEVTADGYRIIKNTEVIAFTGLKSSQRTLKAKSNAKLISAAPELLEACKTALAHLTSPTKFSEREPIAVKFILEEVIKKAEGESE